MKSNPKPSPNFDERAADNKPSILVYHYTGMKSAQAAIERLCDPVSKVSCHYVVDEDGTVLQLVDESKRAWHAGVSFWRGITDVNSNSIGIEIVNPGHDFGYRDFTRPQIAALIMLSKEIIQRYGIGESNIVGHSDIAPSRKIDPGEKFPWDVLAKNGIGFYPPADIFPLEMSALEAQLILVNIGYGIQPHQSWNDETKAALSAFQRRFRPQNFSGEFDAETAGILAWVEDRLSLSS